MNRVEALPLRIGFWLGIVLTIAFIFLEPSFSLLGIILFVFCGLFERIVSLEKEVDALCVAVAELEKREVVE